MMKNIVIVGQGAIGLLCYAKLHQDSALNVTVRASSPTWQQITDISMTDVHGLSRVLPFHYAHEQDLKQADILLLCLKAYHIAPALTQLQAMIKPSCLLILAHNGMGTFEQIQQTLPLGNPMLMLLTTHGSLKPTPLHVRHTGLGQSDLGLLTGQLTQAQQLAVCQLMNQALPTVTWQHNIKHKQWLKLAINSVINPLTAIHNIDNGEVAEPRFGALIEQLLDEVVLVSQADGVLLNKVELHASVLQVAHATAKNCSSMRADLLAGRQTEIDYINGYLVRCAATHGLSVPAHEQLVQAIKLGQP